MVFSGRRGSITFWAWSVSIVVHLLVLAAFGIFKFSHSKAIDKQQIKPTAKIESLRKLIEASPVIPKPKVKRPVKSQIAQIANRTLPPKQVFDDMSLDLPSSTEMSKSSVSEDSYLLSSKMVLRRGIEFFGSFTNKRKICYVVDCSGSMQGVFSRVTKKLAESVSDLQPDQYFSIIFFGDNRLIEFDDGRLVRATEAVKSAACDFINSIEPSGQTNAITALERAILVRDNSANSVAVIYFLTDGFELTDEDADRFMQRITNLLERFAPETKINTIGFWPQEEDRKLLEAIARRSGGEFVFVTD